MKHKNCVELNPMDSLLTAKIYILEDNIFRVMLYKNPDTLPSSQTVSWCDNAGDGNTRFNPQGFTFPNYSLSHESGKTIIETKSLRLCITLDGFHLSWTHNVNGQWLPLLNDRPTQSYNLNGELGHGAYHYIQRHPNEKYMGLGEKSGDVIKNGQSYRFCNIDCMGYDAKSSDPLYKHIPFVLTQTAGSWYGLYYDTYAACRMDLGRELDNYHGHYRYFWADCDYLDYYVIAGHSVSTVVQQFSMLGGRSVFTPRWSLGYLGSTMSYTDSPNPVELLNDFADKCEENQIPCTGFHLSSGYTSIENRRYVFHWNRDKFPDIEGFCKSYTKRGIGLIANIKPCLLADHPLYEQCAKQGLFVKQQDGTPAKSQFWDGMGSWLDFTNPSTVAWWKQNVEKQLLDYGISTWNDNNEFEIWSNEAICIGDGGVTRAAELRPLMTLNMIKASYEAQKCHNPSKRPFLISRSGALGMQRYVQTWTGDNYTCWETLRYNHKMGIGLSLSGIYNFGHDVGGFAGPRPDEELFVRWIQHGLFMPRFSIHSWNDDQTANEPWMYPSVLPVVVQLMKFRQTLTPQLYNLVYYSHAQYEPIVRPLFYHYPDTDYESDLYMLGADMMVANVFDKGICDIILILPAQDDWYGLNGDDYHKGGKAITCPASMEDPLSVFVRAGSVIQLAIDDKQLSYHVFIPESADFSSNLFWDDGESYEYLTSNCITTFAFDAGRNALTVSGPNAHFEVIIHDYLHRDIKIERT